MAKFASMIVEGDSMQPTFNAGDWLMGRWAKYKLTGLHRIKAGDVVVIEREEQPGIFYVKRISQTRASGGHMPTVFVSSDNPTGTDSRQWGWLPITSVRAKIAFRMKRARSQRKFKG
jgi:signal peptidase I